jgi:hypothetical protein
MSANSEPSIKEQEEWMQIFKKQQQKDQEGQDQAKIDEKARKKVDEYWKYKQEKEAEGETPMEFKDWLDFQKPMSYDP